LLKTKEQNAEIAVPQLAIASAQLAVLAWLCHYFELGGKPFATVMLLAVPAFVIHAVIPLRFRLGWYLLVSLAAIFLVLGVANAIWLISIVCGFIGICHIPVALRWRVLLLVAAGSAFAYMKATGWLVPWSHSTWAIVASILMFRIIIYLYDLHHEKSRPPVAWSLSYFFLLPNVCFPLFPVVDFKRFRSTYYSEPAAVVYKRGLLWIFRGIYQLLLYRVIYQFLVIPPGEVLSAAQLLQFMLSAYLLYLRVSGLFHLIVGILLLFGFNLPETHKKYYLASSFNDFWRRINIYWKDFMMKIFYYPVYFKVKSLGPTPALVIATITVFLSTWALHAYQWFWLRGTVLFEAHDLLFWAVLGALVVINSLREIKHGRERGVGNRTLLSFAALAHWSRVISTFTTLCILWSMWSSDSLEQWLLMWRAAGAESAYIAAIVPLFYLLALWADKRSRAAATSSRRTTAQPSQHEVGHPVLAAFSTIAIASLVLLSFSNTALVPAGLSEAASRIRMDQLNRRDQARMERGYYEHLLNVNRHSAGLWEALDQKPADWDENLDDTEAAIHPDNFLLTVLLPNTEISFKKYPLRTNRWGMRDREYAKEVPPNTTRLAFIGSSHVLGSGVANEQVFEHILEQNLNRATASAAERYEILNFAMVAYSALQQLYLVETKVSEFKPHTVVYFQLEGDERFILRNLSMAIRGNIEIPYEFPKAVVAELGLNSSQTDEEIRLLLTPHAERIHAWAEEQLVAQIKTIGARPFCVLLPRVQARPDDEIAEQRQRVTRSAGCHTLNVADVYDGYSQKDLQLASWDNHPNAIGHELIARRLYDELTKVPGLLRPADVATFTSLRYPED
jgi:D-alanyl-lipoteichoic acid acyltransferase DltB (MBOAT superfamily)